MFRLAGWLLLSLGTLALTAACHPAFKKCNNSLDCDVLLDTCVDGECVRKGSTPETDDSSSSVQGQSTTVMVSSGSSSATAVSSSEEHSSSMEGSSSVETSSGEASSGVEPSSSASSGSSFVLSSSSSGVATSRHSSSSGGGGSSSNRSSSSSGPALDCSAFANQVRVTINSAPTNPDGCVAVPYSLSGPYDTDLRVEFNQDLDGGAMWLPATPAPAFLAAGVSSTPAPILGQSRLRPSQHPTAAFYWNSVADVGRHPTGLTVKLRITPVRDGCEGQAAVSPPFTVKNSVGTGCGFEAVMRRVAMVPAGTVVLATTVGDHGFVNLVSGRPRPNTASPSPVGRMNAGFNVGAGGGHFDQAAEFSAGMGSVSALVSGQWTPDEGGGPDILLLGRNDGTDGGIENVVDGILTESALGAAPDGGPPRISVGAVQLGDCNPRGGVLAPVLGDGRLDLVVACDDGRLCAFEHVEPAPPGVFGDHLGIKPGCSQIYNEAAFQPSEVVAGDFNGDGRTDLAVLGNGSGGSRILRLDATPSGNVQPTAFKITSQSQIHDLRSADMDQDGVADVVYAYLNKVAYRRGVPGGDWNSNETLVGTVDAGNTVSGVAVGLINGDRYPDVVFTYAVTDSVMVALSQEDQGTLRGYVTKTYRVAPKPTAVVLDDVDGNGVTDVLVLQDARDSAEPNASLPVSVLLGRKLTVSDGWDTPHGQDNTGYNVVSQDAVNTAPILQVLPARITASGGTLSGLFTATETGCSAWSHSGNGFFNLTASMDSGISGRYQAAAGDMDSDGVDELACHTPGENKVIAYKVGSSLTWLGQVPFDASWTLADMLMTKVSGSGVESPTVLLLLENISSRPQLKAWETTNGGETWTERANGQQTLDGFGSGSVYRLRMTPPDVQGANQCVVGGSAINSNNPTGMLMVTPCIKDARQAQYRTFEQTALTPVASGYPLLALGLLESTNGTTVDELDVVVARKGLGTLDVAQNITKNQNNPLISLATLTMPTLDDLTVVDINGDGREDVVALSRRANLLAVFHNVRQGGTVRFAPPILLGLDGDPSSMQIGDYIPDERPDVVVGLGAGKLFTYPQGRPVP